MMFRKAIVTSILVALCIASAGAVAALYTDYAAKVAAADFRNGLENIPAGYKFVFGLNVQKFVQSPAFSKLRESNPAGDDLAVFVERTGLDPARDIDYMVGAGSQGRNQGIAIVSGRFDREAILSYVRAKSKPLEQSYGGASVLLFPEGDSGVAQRGLAFLNPRQIALGDLESLKAVVDIGGQESRSILSSETMAPLIRIIGPDEMLWFAGDAEGVLARTPANMPLSATASSIKSIVGVMNLGDAITGRITASAIDPEGAQKLAEAVRGLIALGQLVGNQQAEFKSLLGGLTVTQEALQVTIALNFPADLLVKMGQSRGLRIQ